MKYTFTNKKQDEFTYNPAPAVYKFYQICHFKNPTTKKYHVRVSEVNQTGEFIKIEERKYNEIQMAKFMKMHKPNSYKIYPTNDMSIVDYPNPGNILEAQSSILNNNYDNYDYAPVN